MIRRRAVDGGMSLMDPALPLAIQQPELQERSADEKPREATTEGPAGKRPVAAGGA